jgi:PKHD-type hydroxylase
VRDDSARKLLFELDTSIQKLAQENLSDPSIAVQLTGVYHNLLRRWTEC